MAWRIIQLKRGESSLERRVLKKLNKQADWISVIPYFGQYAVLAEGPLDVASIASARIQCVSEVNRDLVKVLIGFASLVNDMRNSANTITPNGWQQGHPFAEVGTIAYPRLVTDSASLPPAATTESVVMDLRREPSDPSLQGKALVACDVEVRLPTRQGHMSAINFSYGFRPGTLPPDHPLSIATEVASAFAPVVVPAGNWRREGTTGSSLSSLARLPWVVSVGATLEEDGGSLYELSSVGDPNDPVSGPTVVACGRSRFDGIQLATSYAAPRVTDCFSVLSAFCHTLRHFVRLESGEGEPEGIALVGTGMIDDMLSPPDRLDIPALPRCGIDRASLRKFLHAAAEAGITLSVDPSPDRLRAMMIACAVPLGEYKPHEIGSGFVSLDTVYDYIAGFDGAECIRIFAESADGGESHAVDFRRFRLVDLSVLHDLMAVWEKSRRTWQVSLLGPQLAEVLPDEEE